MTSYIIAVGYNSGFSVKLNNKDEAWEILKRETLNICNHPEWIIEEARRYDSPWHCEKGPECCNLDNHAERYRPPHKDMTIFINEETKQIVQSCSGDRMLKEHVRRAFCRLLIQAMHRLNIEVNLTVT